MLTILPGFVAAGGSLAAVFILAAREGRRVQPCRSPQRQRDRRAAAPPIRSTRS